MYLTMKWILIVVIFLTHHGALSSSKKDSEVDIVDLYERMKLEFLDPLGYDTETTEEDKYADLLERQRLEFVDALGYDSHPIEETTKDKYADLLERQRLEFVDALGYDSHPIEETTKELGERQKMEFTDALEYENSQAKIEKVSRRRRDAAGGLDIYGMLAGAGGGGVIVAGKGEVINATDFSALTLKSPVLVQKLKFHVDAGIEKSYTFFCDNSLSAIMVQVITSCCHSKLSLEDPDGHTVSTADTNVTVSSDSTTLYTIWVRPPKRGAWKIHVIDGTAQTYDVTIQGDSVLNFEMKFTNERGFESAGNPLSGQNDTYVMITPLGDDTGVVWSVFTISSPSGQLIRTLPLGDKRGHSSPRFRVHITWPNEDVYVGVNGTDKDGFVFVRQRLTPVQPLGIRLSIPNTEKEIIASCVGSHDVAFTLQNEVGSRATFTIGAAVDNTIFNASVSQSNVILKNLETANGKVSVFLTAKTDKEETVQLTITATATDGKTQYVRKLLIARKGLCVTEAHRVSYSHLDQTTESTVLKKLTSRTYTDIPFLRTTCTQETTESGAARVSGTLFYSLLASVITFYFATCNTI